MTAAAPLRPVRRRRALAFQYAAPTDGLPPGPRWPAAAQMLAWMTRPLDLFRHCRLRYGTPFTLRFPVWPPIVSFAEPAHIKAIFTGPPESLLAGVANEPLLPIVGEHSLLTLDAPAHLPERKLLLPPFHGARMQAYGAAMRERTLERMAGWPAGEPLRIHPETQHITLEVILETVFGLSEEQHRAELREALKRLVLRFSNPALMFHFLRVNLGPRSPWGALVRAREASDRLLYAQIERRRAEGAGPDVLGLLLEARHEEDGRPMSDLELRDELMTLLAAGHETTATGLAWALHFLSTHRSVQQRVHEELDHVYGDAPLDPAASTALVYLDAVVKETLRIQPVIGAVGRALTEPRRVGRWELPAGAILSPNIYLTHHHPAIWRRPDRFEPLRFIDRKVSPYEYLPFGGGVRRCIGASFALYEMRIVLGTILQRFRVHPAPGATVRPVRRSVTLAPSGGMPLVLEPR